ncbi:uncharacterized protein LOC124874907 isoform X3 [Girardinichthys multiradiatus]|uniref:uncharacterized protein LOC124874907 isoform X3 n=1 Tax=Girardinichthys multiradiatus TaxID=208333 RepID=UPI001FAC27F1|nr:uncharacterized protein LOC124874907 isoform X3 [Girardinichthys multiradiatus]
MSRLQTTTVTRRSTSGARMSEMKVEAEDPVWLSLEPPIPAALTSELEQKQDSKDLIHQIKEEAPHGWSSSLDQHHPEPPHIKEEEEELWINQEEEQLAVKIEDEEKCNLSELHHIKTEDNRVTENSNTCLVEQMKTEHDGEDDGGPEPDRNPDPECSSQERKMTVHSRGLPNRGRWTALTSRL